MQITNTMKSAIAAKLPYLGKFLNTDKFPVFYIGRQLATIFGTDESVINQLLFDIGNATNLQGRISDEAIAANRCYIEPDKRTNFPYYKHSLEYILANSSHPSVTRFRKAFEPATTEDITPLEICVRENNSALTVELEAGDKATQKRLLRALIKQLTHKLSAMDLLPS